MAVSAQDIVDFLLANPDMSDAQIASIMDQFGVSPADVAQATGVSTEAVQARYESAVQEPEYTPPPAPEPEPVYEPPAPVYTPEPVYELPEPVYTPPSRGAKLELEPENLDVQPPPSAPEAPSGIASLAPAKETPAETPKDTKASSVEKLTQQILAQGTTSQWKGEGKGSAEKNATDMAKILADTGITDINQFGKVTKTVDAAVQPVYGQGDLVTDSEGQQYYSQKIIGYTDQNGNTIDPNLVKSETVYSGGDSGSAELVYTAPIGKQEVFGNKATGQAVADTYGERQTGSAFGGTYTGEGNTGYRVQFDAQGNPTFYTTQASSSDIGDLAPILAIASFIPALAPFAQAINAAIAIDRGDILGGIASLAGVAGLSEVSTGLKVVKAIDDGNAMGIVGALMADSGLNKLASTTMISDGISFADAGNTLKVIDNLSKGDLTGALTTAANLSGSSDAQTAAAGLTLVNAVKTGDLTQIANAAGSLNNTVNATNNVVTQLQDAGLVDKSVNTNTTSTNIQNLLDEMLTVDASGAKDVNAAATFAADSGYNKFTFDGKTYTLDNDNSTANIANLENIVAQETADTKAKTTATNLSGGEFDGVDAQVAATAKANNTVIGNAEADDVTQAAALAKLRNPTGTTFTFDGKTYTLGTSNADVTSALATTQKATALQDIQNAPNFNAAYAAARTALGPNQTFTWNGKQYSTATAAERPDLNITAADKAIEALNASNLATTTNASNTVAAQNDTLARIIGGGPNESNAETRRLLALNAGLDLANAEQKATAAQTAIESVFGKGTAANVVIQGLSNIQQASGQTLDFIGGTGAALGITGANNALTNAGQSMTRTGEKLQLESVNEANANVINAVNNAQGFGAKVIAGAKAIVANPLSINMAAIEVLQEALPMGLALKSIKLVGKLGAIGMDMTLNAIESGGAAYNDKYRDAIKAGKTVEQADAEGTSAFYIASAITVATAGVVDTAVINKITKSVEKAASKAATSTAKETGSEFGEEFLTSVVTDYALTGKVDLNKALTQGVVGGFVAGKTTASIDAASNINSTVADVQQTFTQELNNSGITSTNNSGQLDSFVSTSTGQPVVQTDVVGDLTAAGLTDTTTPTTVGDLSFAEDTGVTTGNVATTTEATTGADTDVVAAQQVMADLGLNVSNDTALSLASQIATANTGVTTGATAEATTGANTATEAATAATTAANTATTAANNTAANVNTNNTTAAATNAATATEAATAANTAADVATNVAATTNSATATNAAVDANTAANVATNAAINANTNVNTNTNTNTNVNTNPNVNTTTNVSTTPTVDTNTTVDSTVTTEPTVITNPTVTTSPTVTTTPTIDTSPAVKTDVNVSTPDAINVGGVSIPGTYEPPSVFTPSVVTPPTVAPTVVTPPTVTPVTPTTPATKTPTKKTYTPTQMPTTGGGSLEPAPLANVFYYGKEFGGQKQQLSPTGELMMAPYQELSVTKAGAEAPVQPIPVAQEAKGGENDISALLQQIFSSGDNNMTQDDLMQIIQSRG